MGEMMNVKIIQKKDNPLLKREDIWCVVEHEGKATPRREELTSLMAKNFNKDADLIIIDKIFSIRGKGSSKVKVFIYKNKESIPKEKIEKIQRRLAKAKKKEESQPEETKEQQTKSEEGVMEHGKEGKEDKKEGQENKEG